MDNMLSILKKAGIKTLVAGMMAPPNMGNGYTVEFNRIYPELAKAYDADLYPFFLEGVAGITKLNQSDAIHPNAKGVAIVVEKIIPYVQKILK
jgi:acyl-CoA thioesterase-1